MVFVLDEDDESDFDELSEDAGDDSFDGVEALPEVDEELSELVAPSDDDVPFELVGFAA